MRRTINIMFLLILFNNKKGNNNVYGTICGDTVGSVWEFNKDKPDFDFELFPPRCGYTDDSIMTIAVADAIMKAGLDADETTMKDQLVGSMQKWGRSFWTGYGQRFIEWIHSENPQPYNSWGNGSAMRVGAIGWLYKDQSLERAREIARWSAELTHNHPEGVKGAEAVVSSIWLALHDKSKDEIKSYVTQEFGYDLDLDKEALRKDYTFDVSCQGTVPVALFAFLLGNDFEECIRYAIWFGGDSDTIGAITGSIAEAFYGIPEELKRRAVKDLPAEMHDVIDRFNEICKGIKQDIVHISTSGLELALKRITLLSRAEYEKHEKIRPANICWWLSDTDEVYEKLVDVVRPTGEVDAASPAEWLGIRPVLILNARKTSSFFLFKNTKVRKFTLFGYDWTMIDENKALCDSVIDHIDFGHTQYQYSKVREYLKNWYEEKTKKYR